jgi:hypothetical protein
MFLSDFEITDRLNFAPGESGASHIETRVYEF